MKKFYLLAALCLFTLAARPQSPHAARLYGMTQYGGYDHKGTIFHYTPETRTIQVDHEFHITVKGKAPKGDMVAGNNGKYYGTASGGGINNAGVIYEWDSTTKVYTELYEFDGENGSDPRGAMVLYNGKFYGMTRSGGTSNAGVIYEWDIAIRTFTKKVDLTDANGKFPDGSLVLVGNTFYGFTHDGGANDKGVLFQWDPAINVYTKRYDFAAATGANPVGRLSLYNNKLYAMTNLGGGNNQGVIYEWDFNTNIYVKKFDFDSIRGQHPSGQLTLYNNKFYGTTYEGGTFETNAESSHYGVLFEWNPANNAFVKKKDLGGTTYPTRISHGPLGSLVVRGNKLWGITSEGFSYYGYIFSWDPATNVWTDHFANTGGVQSDYYRNEVYFQAPGRDSYGSMLLSGNSFYCTSSGSGGGMAGCIFEYLIDSNKINRAVHMQATDGSYPKGSLTRVGNKLFGMTYLGGDNHFGNIFEWDLNTSEFKERFAFDGNKTGGITPGSLTYYNGKLYGSRQFTRLLANNDMFASWAQPRQGSNIFSWNPATNEFAAGAYDQPANTQDAPLTVVGNKLYSTGGGPITQYGAVLQYDPATDSTQGKIYFNGANGDFAMYQDYTQQCGMTLYNGKLYGMTPSKKPAGFTGYTNFKGGIYEYDPATNLINNKIDFNDTTGVLPMGSLTLAGNIFYGVTSGVGVNFGTLFKWNPATNIFTKLVDFNNINGRYVLNPQTTLTYSGGKLYGMGYGFDYKGSLLNSGGSNPGSSALFPGSIFEYDPAIDSLTVVENFAFYPWYPNSGVNPAFTKFLEVIPNQLPLLSDVPLAKTTCSNRADSANFTISDADNDVISFTISSSNTTVLPVQNIVITNVGSTYKVRYLSATNQSGSVTISITGNDGYGGSVNFSLPVTILSPTQATCNSLPVTLISFTARADDVTALLKWSTSAEYNTLVYEVQRSADGINFTKIGAVAAANIVTGHHYSYTDLSPVNGDNYYRLKIVDKDGEFSYSAVRIVSFSNDFFTVYPNPAKDVLFVKINMRSKDQTFVLCDVAGRKLFELATSNSTLLKISLENLSKGVYFLTCSEGGRDVVRKVVKE